MKRQFNVTVERSKITVMCYVKCYVTCERQFFRFSVFVMSSGSSEYCEAKGFEASFQAAAGENPDEVVACLANIISRFSCHTFFNPSSSSCTFIINIASLFP